MLALISHGSTVLPPPCLPLHCLAAGPLGRSFMGVRDGHVQVLSPSPMPPFVLRSWREELERRMRFPSANP
jgi:hypothetical protein